MTLGGAKSPLLPDDDPAPPHDFQCSFCGQHGAVDLAPGWNRSTPELMSIQEHCLQQRPHADRISLNFKCAPAGQLEQQHALAGLHRLIFRWIYVDFAHIQVAMKKTLADIKTR